MRSSNLRIGIDLMGSDTIPQVLFEAVLEATKLLDIHDELIVFATQNVIDSFSSQLSEKIHWKLADDCISMSDEPFLAIRRKKNLPLF